MEIIEYFQWNKPSAKKLRELAEYANDFASFMGMLKAAAVDEPAFRWIATLDTSPVLERCYETWHYFPDYSNGARSGLYMPRYNKLSDFVSHVIAIPMFDGTGLVEKYRKDGYSYIESTHFNGVLLPHTHHGMSCHYMGKPTKTLTDEWNISSDRETGWHLGLGREDKPNTHTIRVNDNTHIGSYALSIVEIDLIADVIEIKETQP